MNKGLEKLNASKPTECDACGGKMIYKGTGEYECAKCRKLMLDDYGKVKRYMDEHGTSSLMILGRETGVSKDVLEYLIEDGVLTMPEEEDTGRKCAKCGNPIESGRYCKSCMAELANGLASAFSDTENKKPVQETKNKSSAARMHLNRRIRG